VHIFTRLSIYDILICCKAGLPLWLFIHVFVEDHGDVVSPFHDNAGQSGPIKRRAVFAWQWIFCIDWERKVER